MLGRNDVAEETLTLALRFRRIQSITVGKEQSGVLACRGGSTRQFTRLRESRPEYRSGHNFPGLPGVTHHLLKGLEPSKQATGRVGVGGGEALRTRAGGGTPKVTQPWKSHTFISIFYFSLRPWLMHCGKRYACKGTFKENASGIISSV